MEIDFEKINSYLYILLYAKDNNLNVYLITLIAGIFGFIIAAIPFTIQVLEIKNNENIALLNRNVVMRKKIFDNYFSVLKSSFWLFIIVILLEFFKMYDITKNIIINFVVISFYIFFVYKFLSELYKLVKILRELVLLYLNDKGN